MEWILPIHVFDFKPQEFLETKNIFKKKISTFLFYNCISSAEEMEGTGTYQDRKWADKRISAFQVICNELVKKKKESIVLSVLDGRACIK